MSDTGQTLKTGTVIDDKWVILEFIAKGGMGEVYRAHQLNLKRDVAIKVISREWLASIEDDDKELELGLMRFRNEVKAMAQVRHPNVVGIYDYGSFVPQEGETGTVLEYIVMEYIPGSTLRETMPEEGFYPNEEATVNWLKRYFFPVLDGVEELHKFGTIHRDIKPENILLDRDIPKIADFGLARSCMLESVTQSIDMKGTPAYMAPEQFLDFKRTDERTDIYALGKILYEAITGKIKPTSIPFKSVGIDGPDTVLFKELDKIIREATVEDKSKRTRSVAELRKAMINAIENWEAKRNQIACPIGKKSEKSLAKMIFIASTLAGAVLLIGLYWFGHSIFNHQNIHSSKSTATKVANEGAGETTETTGKSVKNVAQLPKIIEGKDGAKLR
ncbi:MAG TPA: serine/threonine protein kinase, partial [Deltaproteobacteria bacterium]|nr:serine/threonine protein kinase [Deltaproteobacteria bacterium]